jgi:hypothetical protein
MLVALRLHLSSFTSNSLGISLFDAIFKPAKMQLHV